MVQATDVSEYPTFTLRVLRDDIPKLVALVPLMATRLFGLEDNRGDNAHEKILFYVMSM